ncbi:hypothetical protein F5I97DRAFT_1806556 [Phlebopus sp. FC_14]|nr:hypothetical protein F5I97DRAFT_1806556 [Phlebopus sp. FC_14]
MLLVEVPLILCAALGFHVTLTAPATAKDNEKVKREITITAILYSFQAMKPAYWILSLFMTATALAPYIPSRATNDFVRQLESMHVPMTLVSQFGLALVVLAGILRASCYRTLGPFFTFYLSIRKGHKLATGGPYAFVRHPSYSALLLHPVGMLLAHGTKGSWLRESGVLHIPGAPTVFWVWWVLFMVCVVMAAARAPEEDEMMKVTFGDEWERWAARVKYRLVPYVY